MSDTPIFDEVSEAFKTCKDGWQKQAILESVDVLKAKFAEHDCTKKKCESKCEAFKRGYFQAIEYLAGVKK